MVRAFSLLRNIGKFDNVSAGAQLPLDRLAIIYAENGRGKTTLAAILRSLASGDADLIKERQRLGAQNAPEIVIDAGGSAAVFRNGTWSRVAPEIVVFDDTFVAANVCSGIEVGPIQRQNLHELIIGAQGIALNRSLQEEVERIEAHNRALREREFAIPQQFRGNLNVEAFCALQPIQDLTSRIEDADRRLAAARDASRIAAAPSFPDILLPMIDLAVFERLLSKTLPDLDATALEGVQKHLARLGKGSERWVAQGVDIEENLRAQGQSDCPFCGQDLAGSSLLSHYRDYFGAAYTDLKLEIEAASSALSATHGRDVPSAFERTIRTAIESRVFWTAFAEVPEVEVDTATIARAWKTARDGLEELLRAKANTPLEPIELTVSVRHAVAEHNRQCRLIRSLADELHAANANLDLVKEQARNANVSTLTADLANLRAVQSRWDPSIGPLCESYLAEKANKTATEQRRNSIRGALDQHRQSAFPAYGVLINDYLQRFNATFRVGPVDPVNTRGGSAANYTLLVEGVQVPLAGASGPSFRNTLSAGDRNTLALAFFFASLQSDPQRANKVVVIDDPMTSLDEHRTLHTLQEIDRLVHEVASMVVLSHSKPFLLGVWDKCRQVSKCALQVQRVGTGSTLAHWDVHAAMVNEHDRRHEAAVAYLVQGDPQVARRVAESLRPMLEAFCRVAYPGDFPPGFLLGPFHGKCVQRLGAPNEIMSESNATELRYLLDYGNRFHHDSNAAYATEIINDAELEDFTRRTIRFIRR